MDKNYKAAVKKPTMTEIAALLGVSKNTVSLALNGKPGVGAKLRAQIIDKAEELGYGGFFAQKQVRSRCVAVLVPQYIHTDAFFYSEVFWAVEAEARSRGIIPINIGITHEMEQELVLPAFPNEMRTVGMLIIGVFSEKYAKMLYDTGIPLLSVDIAYNNVPIGCVGSANLRGGYIAAKRLVDAGHKKIGFIGPYCTARSIYERYTGFKLALYELNAEVNEELFLKKTASGGFELWDSPEALEPYFNAMQEYPTAFFCAGDRIAIALMSLLAQRGIRVPEDISVIGFDDISVAQIFPPGLTTINVDRTLMGALAVERLLKLSEDERRAVDIAVPVTLVERGTVKEMRNA